MSMDKKRGKSVVDPSPSPKLRLSAVALRRGSAFQFCLNRWLARSNNGVERIHNLLVHRMYCVLGHFKAAFLQDFRMDFMPHNFRKLLKALLVQSLIITAPKPCYKLVSRGCG